MKHIGELIGRYVDFYFALVIITVLGTGGSLYLQFAQADVEFETLNGSMYSIVRSQKTMDERENAVLNHQLEQLKNELNALNL